MALPHEIVVVFDDVTGGHLDLLVALLPLELQDDYLTGSAPKDEGLAEWAQGDFLYGQAGVVTVGVERPYLQDERKPINLVHKLWPLREKQCRFNHKSIQNHSGIERLDIASHKQRVYSTYLAERWPFLVSLGTRVVGRGQVAKDDGGVHLVHQAEGHWWGVPETNRTILVSVGATQALLETLEGADTIFLISSGRNKCKFCSSLTQLREGLCFRLSVSNSCLLG